MDKTWDKIKVKALIYTNEQEVATGVQEFQSNQPNTISMIVSHLVLLFANVDIVV